MTATQKANQQIWKTVRIYKPNGELITFTVEDAGKVYKTISIDVLAQRVTIIDMNDRYIGYYGFPLVVESEESRLIS